MKKKRIVAARSAILALLLSASPATAHAFLEHASPGAGAKIAVSPDEIALRFSQALEPALSGVTVTDDAQRRVGKGEPLIEGDSMRIMLMHLAMGSYLVEWHVVSSDGHRTEGRYRFTVGP